MKKIISLCLVPCALCIGLTACAPVPKPVTVTEFMLDTLCTVTVYYTDKQTARAAADAALARCRELEQVLSVTVEGSDIWNINLAGGKPVVVLPETAQVLAHAYSTSMTGRDSVFDVTAGKLTALWKFSQNDFTVPAQDAIDNAKATVGFRQLHIDGLTVTLDGGAHLDLGGIAKGFIADEMRDVLESRGITSALISLGGNVVTVGNKPDGKPFRIGIKRPFSESGEMVGVLHLDDGLTVSTTGIDERGAWVGDVYYHHVIDLATGYPADTGLHSVSVVCEKSIDADALSLVCFLLGLDDGLAFIEAINGTEAVFIGDDGEVVVSSGIGTLIGFEG